MLVFAASYAAGAQALGTLRIKIVLADADGKATPLADHALLISDNPSTSTPRRVVTHADGTAEVRLRPGNYTVESDNPSAFNGKAYQWTQTLDVPAGRDTLLELTVRNAEIGPIRSAPAPVAPAATASAPAARSTVRHQWEDSVVELWTPFTHASGFVVDQRGLIVTNQRGVGKATTVEVQLAPDLKFAASVLAADPAKDVAVLRADPSVLGSRQAVPLACAAPPPVPANGQELITLSVPLEQQKDLATGTMSRGEKATLIADIRLPPGGAGGPVFTADGRVAGLTSLADGDDQRRRKDAKLVAVADVCAVVAAAGQTLSSAAAPSVARLPTEPIAPIDETALKNAAERRIGSLNPYQVSSSNFEVWFFTPVLTYGAIHRLGSGGRYAATDPKQLVAASLSDFGNWSEYAAEDPPVVLIRVRPKLEESFWTTVARGAAQTQGVPLPAMKHFKGTLSRMTIQCDAAELTPIHALRIERRLSENDVLYEGLYVVDPAALSQCGSVKVTVFSEKEPQKGEPATVDPRIVKQIGDDFALLEAKSR
jgi:hypothetical protein